METDSKIEKRLLLAEDRFISPLLFPDTETLNIKMWQVGGEPVSYAQALEAEYQTVKEGDPWGQPWDTAWFHFSGRVPERWRSCEVVALIDLSFEQQEGFGREGLVWIEGKPMIAVSRNRTAVPLFEDSSGNEEVEFHVEAAANPAAEWHWGKAEHEETSSKKPLFRVKQARLAIRDEQVFQLLIDYRVCREAMQQLPLKSMRRARLRRALSEACQLMNSTSSSWVEAARKVLEPVMTCKNGDTAQQVFAVGHAHIDTAWCWPLRESIRKCARTFSTALAYMEKHPDYHFSCSQPIHYVWMKHHYPDIFSGIQAAVKRGQWEPVGSMWVEADCNIPSGESLVRQIMYGKHFFEREFGVETRDLWLPDVFGYSSALPQITQKSGIDWFMSQKISWNDTNTFPYHSFLWEGHDGSQVFTHFPPVDTYNGRLTAEELNRADQGFTQKDQASSTLLPFGQGDGGGGPTLEMIERARRWKDFEGLPRVKMGTVREFFEQAEAEMESPPIWHGELYLELHRGTYTSQGRNKRSNRQCESLLREAEFFEALADILDPSPLLASDPIPERSRWDLPSHDPCKDGDISATAIERAWKLLLLNQFHDIIPGSSIGRVYEDSSLDYQVIKKIGTTVRDAAIDRLTALIPVNGNAPSPIALNSLAQDRQEVIETLSDGVKLISAPACGYALISETEVPTHPVETRSTDGKIWLSNGLVELNIGVGGRLESVRDIATDRELMDGSGNQFHLLNDHPNLWNAWDIDAPAMDDYEIIKGGSLPELVESGPLRAIVDVELTFGSSRLTQRIILRANSRRIDFETEVDWQERHRLLKVAFPTTIHTNRATCEVQHGHIERETRKNPPIETSRFEVCAQAWVDLSEPDFGVALLNNGRYGHDFRGSEMRLSLLKGAHAPDPHADLGLHQFTYSLFPHEGTAVAGRVPEEAQALNNPIMVREANAPHTSKLESQSWMSFQQDGVVLEALKKAEDGNGYIARFRECYGTRKEVSLDFNLPLASVQEVDLLERPLEFGASSLTKIVLRPFDLRSFRLTMAK